MINLNKPQFICIISCLVEETKSIHSSAVIFPSFDEALEYARKDSGYYRHLASHYLEKVGTGKKHASIQMNGKKFNKSYTIRDLNYDNGHKVLDTHLNTYSSWDYDHEGIAI